MRATKQVKGEKGKEEGVMVEKGSREEGRERGGREVKVCWREEK